MKEKIYIAIDLKSFYASVECVQRNLDPLDAYLVVADKTHTEKTICLAVTPALKDYGISGRARLFEVIEAVDEINRIRGRRLLELYDDVDATGRHGAVSKNFTKKCTFDAELQSHPEYELDYIVAPPQMAKYIEVSTQIYEIYLRYVAPQDIHVYSIDEVFIDATPYLMMHDCTAEELARRMIADVLAETSITATVGIGTNMYLSKIAMDVFAKRMTPDKNGARIAFLDEQLYREHMWNHRPLSDFWMIGAGYTRRLEAYGMHTMGDIARCSVENEDLLYEIFGINAELLIDHAWGWEPCTIADVKAYKPVTNSVSSGQVLHRPYKNAEGRLVLREMADALSQELVSKNLVTKKLVIHVGYDIKNIMNIQKGIVNAYAGEIKTDHYGRKVPKYARKTINLLRWTSSATIIMDAVADAFDEAVDKQLLIRRFNVTAEAVLPKAQVDEALETATPQPVQMSIFTNYELEEKLKAAEDEKLERELELQRVMLAVKEKFGKNAILRGMNLQDGATMKQRNAQIGGHKA